MAITTTNTAYNLNAYASRASLDHDGWVPRFDEPEAVSIASLGSLAAVSNPVVNSLTELLQPFQEQPADSTTLTASIDTDDDELRGVFAEMAMDRQTRVAARAQLAQTVQEDWHKTQEEVRTNEQTRQVNMSNMWRSSFNPYGGGGMMPMPMPMPMPMSPMQPGMTPGMPGMPMQPQLGMQVSTGQPMQPGMPGYQPGMPGYPGAPGMMPGQYPGAPGVQMAGTYGAYPGQLGSYPGQMGAYPNANFPGQTGTMSPAMVGAPPYYFR